MQPKIPLASWARSTYLLLEVFLLTAVFNAALNLLSDAELLIAEVRISQRAALWLQFYFHKLIVGANVSICMFNSTENVYM